MYSWHASYSTYWACAGTIFINHSINFLFKQGNCILRSRSSYNLNDDFAAGASYTINIHLIQQFTWICHALECFKKAQLPPRHHAYEVHSMHGKCVSFVSWGAKQPMSQGSDKVSHGHRHRRPCDQLTTRRRWWPKRRRRGSNDGSKKKCQKASDEAQGMFRRSTLVRDIESETRQTPSAPTHTFAAAALPAEAIYMKGTRSRCGWLTRAQPSRLDVEQLCRGNVLLVVCKQKCIIHLRSKNDDCPRSHVTWQTCDLSHSLFAPVVHIRCFCLARPKIQHERSEAGS